MASQDQPPPEPAKQPGKKPSPAKKRAQKAAQRKEWSQEEIDRAFQEAGGIPKATKPKHPGGRPSGYEKIDLKQVQFLAERGFTDQDLAGFFHVSRATIAVWKNKHSKFLDTLKLGKEAADNRVERSLYERATGYSHPEEKVFYDNQVGKVVVHPTVKHYPPDTAAAFIWLQNRRPTEWKHRNEAAGPNPEAVEKTLKDIADAIQERDGTA